ncbi:hypothetical protein DYQ86_20730 [Acidobacteria bacterium AB60]|nr:hypothetical protein DYQ86_20730 [Acidobacteria bacterium AB60]
MDAAMQANEVSERVVVRLGDEAIKGFLDLRPGDTIDALLQNVTAAPPPVLRIRRLDNGTVQEIPIDRTKAIFYVNDFNGDPDHRDLHFYRGAPIVHGVWIRLEFVDGEVMEGLVHNTIRFLLDPGFFIRPTDPRSNNRLVYVVKKWLKECRVLGLRDI